jgi:hypothetical protein
MVSCIRCCEVWNERRRAAALLWAMVGRARAALRSAEGIREAMVWLLFVLKDRYVGGGGMYGCWMLEMVFVWRVRDGRLASVGLADVGCRAPAETCMSLGM